MKDSPVPARIFLTLTNGKTSGEEFIALSGTLYRQNLIFLEPRELRRDKNTLELTVIFQDVQSFKNWQKNQEVQQVWNDKFDKQLAAKPKTLKERDVIIEADNVINCNCGKTKFLILQGRSFRFTDELICNNCLNQVPYSKIPHNIQIEDWQRHYERVYLNWLDSGLFEKEAYKELTNYKYGKLNKQGETIRKLLSEFFKTPVYINYFIEETDAIQTCPVCGQKGVKSGLKKPNKICKSCNTIFSYKDK